MGELGLIGFWLVSSLVFFSIFGLLQGRGWLMLASVSLFMVGFSFALNWEGWKQVLLFEGTGLILWLISLVAKGVQNRKNIPKQR
jgi:hypothetical protein